MVVRNSEIFLFGAKNSPEGLVLLVLLVTDVTLQGSTTLREV